MTTSTNELTIGKFYLSATGDLCCTLPEGGYFRPIHPALQPIQGALIAMRDGGEPVLPANVDIAVYEALADTLRLMNIYRTKFTDASQRLGTIRRDIRSALLEAWESHKDHITRESMNEFLEANDMDPAPRTVRSARVKVVATQWVDIEDLELEDGDDVNEALLEHARQNTYSYGWDVDDDEGEVDEDSVELDG